MQQTPASQTPPSPAWRNPWLIGWFALVAVFLAVNGVMIYLAVTTNPGLVVDDYYDRGQYYEHNLASKLARNPGWAMSTEIPQDLKAGETRVLRFLVADKAGQPISLDGATFYAYRPSDVGRDFSLPMEPDGPGRYVVKASFPLMGVWDVLFAGRLGGDEHSHGRRLIVARP
jgi:nitrogen fixation protein FixH